MEKRKVIAALKKSSIEIDPIEPITVDDVMNVLKNFIADNKIEGFVTKDGNKIKIIILSNTNAHTEKYLLTCPHCGKVSIYEEEMNIHIKTHYIGF